MCDAQWKPQKAGRGFLLERGLQPAPLPAGLFKPGTIPGGSITAPDGYQGWIGPFEYDNTVWCDVHLGDVLFNGMAGFAEVVLGDP
jgi:hypothetical protein